MEKLENFGFNTDALSKYKYKGAWFSLKNKEKTKSFKVTYRGILDICVPEYAIDEKRKQFKMSRNHNFWVMLNYEWFKRLGLESENYKKGYMRLINMTANQLYELISQINYLINLKNKYINKEAIKLPWVAKKIEFLICKVIDLLKKFYKTLKIWDFKYALNLFE